MKLSAFWIKNFKSIIDSSITHLSHDNITTIIGQNESGKTSILEALNSFSNGMISEDMIRSDSTFPVISCYFDFNEKILSDYLNMDKVAAGLKAKLENKQGIWLQRSWKNLGTSIFTCSDNDLVEFYDELKAINAQRVERILNLILKIDKETNELRNEIQVFEKDKNELIKETAEATKRMNKAKRKLDRNKKADYLQQYRNEHEAAQKLFIQKKNDLDEIVNICNEKWRKLEKYGESDPLAQRFLKIQFNYTQEQEKYNECIEELDHLENLYQKAKSSKEMELLADKIDQQNNIQKELHCNLIKAKDDLDFIERVADKVFEGKNSRVSESEVKIERSKQHDTYSLIQIAEELTSELPVFELFEDFASLLPNRIDLFDLFDNNTNTEGYKAVNNFLAISGLSSKFFKQENDRILKQRIENLNGELTIDFQEFWSQNISSENKIHLNFELEHYNYNHPNKSGQPYLEFWIKDNYERLYPKQRSRGVRWFLSFYLELKAIAISQQKKVLLIDEPGLSLHAKAQQDVLKVFENLKDDLQIVYCTHSPQLIDSDKMYRILAVQRKSENGINSQSIILDSKSLNTANNETMMPIFSVLGDPLIQNQSHEKTKKLIVENICSFYYLTAFSRLLNRNEDIRFIPSGSVEEIPIMANILTGWRTKFSVLIPNNTRGQKVADRLKESVFISDKESIDEKLLVYDEENMVDLISKLDFKKYILKQRIGIPESNSEYIEINNLSANYLASQFANMVDDDTLKPDNLDEQTLSSIQTLMDKIDHIAI